ncbi:MAG: hypothetical protein UV63_C0003G0019 [Microgenomates group bacterium GW2011_GWC1_43_11]|uniref:DUF2304 domain-containing protein n=2 Tax=Candidatus Gottesmaniibacteriota TaxID=1752720 RepID=A0A0G1KYH9_9BACT|nr:MAG: hypothetical protein UV63_C0003G0019 [Microgenomates group bacterium GW2011_GWC1_43_11]KKT38982.1 MAG: hypothetical protein UW22_C0003G0024 [Candidatus Gottesmanbacteria bacterium GW2011_GWB1_44_11c]KKT61407.1 MAG: hypothetical protein UW52_C0004G0019 [Candidatus Gottesmanbacteria bacterium GW2011_GWA1_44_24b]HCM81758.1 hypothetical protein [Patescibacteria group bacterium]
MFNIVHIGTVTIYQIVLAFVASFIIGQRLLRFIRRETSQSLFKMLTVIGIWGGIGAIALFPKIAHFIRIRMGFGENFNTIIFITFVILFVLFFRILSIIERIENTITELIRREALRDIQKMHK